MAPASDLQTAYRTYGPALIRKAERILRNREDATDLVHGLFCDLLTKPPPAMDLPYFYRAVTNRCLNQVRDRANRERLLAREQPAPEARVRCDDQVIGLELLARLGDRLDGGHMEVLVCRFLDDMTQEEIAEHLDLSRKTVGKRLAHIREEVARL